MYKNIYVPVDNSDLSNRAAANAVRLGQTFESKLVGCHVYAAKMHDYRFKQMEYTLPDEYLEETELDRPAQDPRQPDHDGAGADLRLLPRG